MISSRPQFFRSLALVCGRFLMAVLSIDLMFDTLALDRNLESNAVSPRALAIIKVYYQPVTNEASPMHYLVGLAMLSAIVSGISLAMTKNTDRWSSTGVAILPIIAVGLALLKIKPESQQFASGKLTEEAQSRIAESVFYLH